MAWLIPIAVQGAGMALGAYGSVKEAQAARSQGAVDNVLAQREAEQLDRQATGEVATATYNAQRIQQRAKEIVSEQQLAAAAGGGDSTDGTAVAIRKEAIRNSSLDSMLEIAMAEDRANQLRYEASATRKSGVYKEKLGKDRARGALVRGAQTLVQGAANWRQTAEGTKPPKDL